MSADRMSRGAFWDAAFLAALPAYIAKGCNSPFVAAKEADQACAERDLRDEEGRPKPDKEDP